MMAASFYRQNIHGPKPRQRSRFQHASAKYRFSVLACSRKRSSQASSHATRL